MSEMVTTVYRINSMTGLTVASHRWVIPRWIREWWPPVPQGFTRQWRGVSLPDEDGHRQGFASDVQNSTETPSPFVGATNGDFTQVGVGSPPAVNLFDPAAPQTPLG